MRFPFLRGHLVGRVPYLSSRPPGDIVQSLNELFKSRNYYFLVSGVSLHRYSSQNMGQLAVICLRAISKSINDCVGGSNAKPCAIAYSSHPLIDPATAMPDMTFRVWKCPSMVRIAGLVEFCRSTHRLAGTNSPPPPPPARGVGSPASARRTTSPAPPAARRPLQHRAIGVKTQPSEKGRQQAVAL